MHVLIAGPIHADGTALLQSSPGLSIDLIDDVSTPAFAAALARTDAVLIRTQPLQAAAIVSARNLRIVSRHGVGYDAIDVAALTARSIPLAIVGDVNSGAVAEHAMMLMLALARQTLAYDAATRKGDWKFRNSNAAFELDGKALLIIGFGRIGRRVARLAQAFGMKVVAHDPLVAAASFAEAGTVPAKSLEEGLAQADFVTLHIPALPGGAALMGASELACLKPSAFVINTARGGLIDEVALEQALTAGRLAGAGLDVFADEPPPRAHPLLQHPHVLMSPHSASLTRECARRMALAAAQNILDYFAGTLDPKLVVNADRIGLA